MKKRLFVIMIMAIICFSFMACSGDDNSEKQVPVYLGMTISSAGSSTQNARATSNTSGDVSDKNDVIDQDEPFGDNASDIEKKVTLNVNSSDEVEYYAIPNQEILITIKLSNPDSYEILSFTLNEYKYQSYQFQDGSDSQNLILKLNVGQNSGIIEYTIDAIKYVDGIDIKDVAIDGNKTVKAGVRTSNQVTALIQNQTVSLDSIAFDVTVTDTKSLIPQEDGSLYAALFDGEQIISTKNLSVGVKTNVVFNELKPNTIYQYAIVANYDNLSGFPKGVSTNILAKNAVYTDAIVLFDASKIVVSKDSVEFDFIWHNDITQKNITKTEIFKNNQKVKDVSGKSADGLLSNNTYIIKATYKNLANQDETISMTFTTLAKQAPTMQIDDVVSTQDSVGFVLNTTDTDSVGAISAIQLYKGETLASELTDLSLRTFDGLDGYTNYTIKATYTYDLNDGEGIKTLVDTKSITTLAQLEVISARVINTSAVSIGETIIAEATLDNPNSVAITRVQINGEDYSPALASTSTKLRVEILVDSAFEGGSTDIVFEKLYYTVEGVQYCVDITQDNIATCFVNGELVLESIQIVDDNNEPIIWGVSDEQYYYLITLRNRTGYSVTSVTINSNVISSENITVIDDEHLIVSATYNSSNIQITSISYEKSGIGSKTKAVDLYTQRVHYISNSSPINITTADELKNMNSNGYYVLQNDIDLGGSEWEPAAFSGVFDGNGHTIKNMSIVTSFENANLDIGLFSTACGVIKNLKIKDTLFMITLTSTTQTEYTVNLGALVGKATNLLYIDNVSIDGGELSVNASKVYMGGLLGYTGYNFVTVTNSNSSASVSAPNGYAGGLVGFSCYSTISSCYATGDVTGGTVGGLVALSNTTIITNCYATGNVTASGQYSSAGGLLGHGDEMTIINCHAIGNVTANGQSSEAGGLVGSGNSTITNCYATGDVTGGGNAGGLVGYNSGATITNCYAIGNVTGNYVGGLVGYGNSTITNCYATGNVTGNYVGGLVGYGYGTITNCYATGNATGNVTGNCVGGLVGTNYSTITNCYATGNVIGDNYAGGLVGESYGSTITNSYATGNVTGSRAGGLVGNSYNGTITNCYATGDVTGGGNAGGLVGNSYNSSITNCYSYEWQVRYYEDGSVGEFSDNLGTPCTLAELNSTQFYTTTLGWDNAIWDFSDLDFANAKYPFLK